LICQAIRAILVSELLILKADIKLMKTCKWFISLFLSVMSLGAQAGWEVANPGSAVPREPFFQAGTAGGGFDSSAYGGAGYPSQYATLGQPSRLYAVSISGSLKENLERIMGRYHWRVIWKAPYDYNFDGRVTGASLPNVVEKLLQPFPLQAIMYSSNRTLAVVARTG